MLHRDRIRASALVAAFVPGCVLGDDVDLDSIAAEVDIQEPSWSLLRSVALGNPQAAHYNPRDGLLYVGRRSSSSDGVYRINEDGSATKVANGDRVAALAIDPVDGDIFFSEDFDGVVIRKAFGNTSPGTREFWLTDFSSGTGEPLGGDDDPVGLAIAPPDFEGDAIAPGEGVIVDRGSGGPDDVWRWSTSATKSERLLHRDNGTLVDPVDVAVTRTGVYVVDAGSGALYQVHAGGGLTPVALSASLSQPLAVAADPLTGGLLVLDAGADTVVSVDLETGEVAPMASGFHFTATNWAGLDVSPDGTYVFVTDAGAGAIHTFVRDPNEPPVAVCAAQVVAADDACLGAASIDWGSYDPDGDPVEIVQDPPGPYEPGVTAVTLTITDDSGESSSCAATVTVVDMTAPVIDCNAPAVIPPPDAPVSFTAEVWDNCAPGDAVVSDPECTFVTGSGWRRDRECCEVTAVGDTIVIERTSGVGTRITWRVSTTDADGNEASAECAIDVVIPGTGG